MRVILFILCLFCATASRAQEVVRGPLQLLEINDARMIRDVEPLGPVRRCGKYVFISEVMIMGKMETLTGFLIDNKPKNVETLIMRKGGMNILLLPTSNNKIPLVFTHYQNSNEELVTGYTLMLPELEYNKMRFFCTNIGKRKRI